MWLQMGGWGNVRRRRREETLGQTPAISPLNIQLHPVTRKTKVWGRWAPHCGKVRVSRLWLFFSSDLSTQMKIASIPRGSSDENQSPTLSWT